MVGNGCFVPTQSFKDLQNLIGEFLVWNIVYLITENFAFVSSSMTSQMTYKRYVKF